MKKIKIFLGVIAVLSLSSCLKDKGAESTAFEHLDATVEFYLGGKSFFSNDAVIFAADTFSTDMYVNIASEYPLTKDLTITVGVDTTLVPAYNAYDTSIAYKVLPSAAYTFPDQTFTIPAGKRLDTLHLDLYRATLDPTTSYMLPIVIKDASGVTISGNKGVHYYHVIGNPIAGTYTQEWIRWNNAAGTGAPAFDETFDGVFSPISPTEIGVESGTGMTYLLSFTNTDGVLSDFTVAFGENDASDNGIAITSGPTIISADPVTGSYEFTFSYDNLAGGLRVIKDKFTK